MSKKKSNRYHQQAEQIRNRLNNRPYTIGLDMGVGSIGLAVIALEEQGGRLTPTDPIFTTSRIFTPSTGASERKEKRGQRNSIRHKSNRLRFLWKLLASQEIMLPVSTEVVPDPAILRFDAETRKKDPYSLRMKGLSEQLSTSELGYALYHIANHRGASSIRTFLDDEKSKEDEKLDEQMRETEKLVKEKGLGTFIEVLAAFNQDKLIGYRNIDKLKASKVPVPTRDIIENEITALLSTQSEFYPEVLSAEYQQKILDAILYENEKIVPEAGNCPYYPDEKKLPKCHFLNEERRIWEAINNARVIEPEQQAKGFIKWTPTPFTVSERKNLFVFLREGKDLTPTAVKNMFDNKYKNCEMTLQGRDVKTQKIKGFRFKDLEERSFWKAFTEDQQDQFLYAWINTPDDKKLKQLLVDTFNLSDDVATDAMKTVKLIGDYAPIGKTATKLILKYLEDGASYTEAIEKGVEAGELEELIKWEVQEQLPYYGKILTGSTQAIMGKYWHSAFKEKKDLAGFHKPKTYWEEEHYGRIANPVVHQSLNELRKLLNEMIDILGSKPTELVVELGRELKIGAEMRNKISMDQNKRERESERLYTEYCLPNNLPKKYIQHFRLLTEQQFICPYCLKTINVAEVANGTADIDHIFPRRETADDSLANKVVSHGSCNKEKGKRTPFAAFSNKDNWTQIMHYMATNPDMYAKRKKFEKNEEEYKKYLESRGFVSRFKTDNSYIAKAVIEYLRCLYPTTDLNSVRSLNGRETSILRKAWDLQKISSELGDLHIQKNKDENDLGRKDRTDNRHHSLDALVAGYCSRSLIKKINDLSSKGFPAEEIERTLPVPGFSETTIETANSQKEVFSKKIKAFLMLNGFISLKIDTSVNGTLLKDTIYSILGANEHGEELIFVVKKNVASISVKDGSLEEVEKAIHGRFSANHPKWYSDELKTKIEEIQDHNQKIITRYQESLQNARQLLETNNEKNKEEGKKPLELSTRNISKKALELCGGTYYLLSNNTRQKTFVAKEPTKQTKGFAYDTGSNLCLDLYHDKEGVLRGEIIRNIQAMNKEFTPKYKQAGFSLYERIYQGDVLEIDGTNPVELTEKSSGSDKVASVRTPNALSTRTFVSMVTFTEVGSGVQAYYANITKSRADKDASFTLGSLTKLNARKVVLSPAGLVSYVSGPLLDIPKEE